VNYDATRREKFPKTAMAAFEMDCIDGYRKKKMRLRSVKFSESSTGRRLKLKKLTTRVEKPQKERNGPGCGKNGVQHLCLLLHGKKGKTCRHGQGGAVGKDRGAPEPGKEEKGRRLLIIEKTIGEGRRAPESSGKRRFGDPLGGREAEEAFRSGPLAKKKKKILPKTKSS